MQSCICTISILGCSFLSVSYVLSLYIWKNDKHRDHPSTIKKRFLSIAIMAMFSPLFVYVFTFYGNVQMHTTLELLGLRKPGFLMACTVPLLLTVVLFLGPIVIQTQSDAWILYSEPRYWTNNFKNILWLRNHVVAPLSEELTFRACMLPVLVQCFKPQNSVFICSLFFGIAHLHHVFGQLKSGADLQSALLLSGFQVLYTTMFGAYSAFLFLRTGHLIAPFLVHSFCNYMGFPDFSAVLSYREPQRILTLGVSVAGLICWCFLLLPLTNPSWYNNAIYWKS